MSRRSFSRIWVGVLLSAGVLLLSGCWGYYTNVVGPSPTPQPYVVTVNKETTDEAIQYCSRPGFTVENRARCVLSLIRGRCQIQMLQGWDQPRCDEATDHNGLKCRPDNGAFVNCWLSMNRAIERVVFTSDDCFAYEYRAGVGESRGWWATPLGGAGTPYPCW